MKNYMKRTFSLQFGTVLNFVHTFGDIGYFI